VSASTGAQGDLPTGEVTFVFTDIQGSTALLVRLGEGYASVLDEHHRILYEAFESTGGQVFGSAGDALFAAYVDPRAALTGAVAGQLRLLERNRTSDVPLAVRMGVHTGPAVLGPTGYVGLGLHHTARVAAKAQGSQILVSDTTATLLAGSPLPGVTLDDLGPVRLKDVPGSPHVFCVRHPDLPADFAPLVGGVAPLGNLPAPLTTFVGRDKELAELSGVLATTRLVTLVATSGTGKTRLAVEAAGSIRDRYPDGVWLVDLSEVDGGDEDVAGAVASSLGIPDTGEAGGVGDALVRSLAGRECLVVLDNCERAADGVTSVATRLARGAPKLHMLATSQRPLHVEGEMVYRLAPLGLPEPGKDPAEAASVRLFVERARAVRNGFELDPRSARAVARICERLDGIPFAIELAAARVVAFSAAQLAARLEESLGIPVPSTGPARHATLRQAVGWSYDLLTPDERTLLARLSVFSGGCTLEAAEAVCGTSETRRSQVMATLASLVEKSLVVFSDQGVQPSYRLLQMVRTFAAERLVESGESASVADRHLDFYLAFAEESAPHLTGPEQGCVEDLLADDLDNLRTAFHLAMSKSDASPALRLANALCRFLEDRGHWREWRSWFEQALGHPGHATPSERGWALANGSAVAERLGDLDLCEARASAAAALFTELGDDSGCSFALGFLGNAAIDRGESDRAVAFYERALAMRERLGDRRGVGVSLGNLGWARYEGGDHAAARPLLEEALAMLEECGDMARAIAVLGDVALVSLADGAVETAFDYALRGVDLARDAGNRQTEAWNTVLLGRIVAALGQPADAGALLAEAMQILSDLDDDRSLLTAIGELAIILAEQHPLPAVELLAAVRAIRGRRHLPANVEERIRLDAAEAAITASTPVDARESAIARGSRFQLDDAVRRSVILAGTLRTGRSPLRRATLLRPDT